MTGKNKCKILKEIRQMIADENDIPYVTAYCRYKGECAGTCPACEAELAYLERELLRRQKEGKRNVAIGISVAALLIALGSCDAVDNALEKLSEKLGSIVSTGAIVANTFDVDLNEQNNV